MRFGLVILAVCLLGFSSACSEANAQSFRQFRKNDVGGSRCNMSPSPLGHVLDENTLALFRMDECSSNGTSADAAGGTALTPLAVAPAVIDPSQIKRGRDFGTIDQGFERAGSPEQLIIHLADMTVEAWIWIETAHTAESVFYAYAGAWASADANERNLFSLGATGGTGINTDLKFRMGGYSGSCISCNLPRETWTHVAVAREAIGGGNCTISYFINGVPDDVDTTTCITSGGSNSRVQIGQWDGDQRNFLGYLDDIRVSSVARSGAEILESYETGMGL